MPQFSAHEIQHLLSRAGVQVETRPRARAPRAAVPSANEGRFLELLQAAPDLPHPVRQHRFHPTRRWLFDFAWPDARLAVEIDGGYQCAGGGRHNSQRDREKLAAAEQAGWHVLHFVPQELACGSNVLWQLRAALDYAARNNPPTPPAPY